MTLPLTTILFVGVIGALLLGGLGLRLIFAPENAQDKAASQRIKGLNAASGHTLASNLVNRQSRKSVGRIWPIVGDLALAMRRARLENQQTKVYGAAIAGGIGLGVILMVPIGNPIALLIGVGIAALTLSHILKVRHKKYADAVTRQLPDALDLITRGLRVGHPVNATIANVARTMPDPIGTEFRELSEQVSHGDYLTDAFNDMAERIGQEDVEYLATAIAIQHGTGGNLAEILGTLSKVIRDRIVMRRRIRAISSEGRASAYILSALPVVIYLATSLTAPGYYSSVSDDPAFMPIAFIIVALVVGNFLALRKLVSFEL